MAAELLNRRMSRSAEVPDRHPCAVVVLGYPSKRSGLPHPIQRVRVGAGVRVFREHGADLMVMCGGAVSNATVEADTMVELARERGVDPGVLVAERLSRNTWENVKYAAPLVEHCEVVVIVSEPMHAARARRYWLTQFPADIDRVVLARRRPFEHAWLTTPATFYELALSTLRPSSR